MIVSDSRRETIRKNALTRGLTAAPGSATTKNSRAAPHRRTRSPGRATQAARRHESALYSRLKWCYKPLDAGDETKPISPEPPVSDRKAAREAKAEARRQAKLRKLGRRRA